MNTVENNNLFTEITSEEAATLNGGFALFSLPNWAYPFPFFYPQPRLTPGKSFGRSLRKQNLYRSNMSYFS